MIWHCVIELQKLVADTSETQIIVASQDKSDVCFTLGYYFTMLSPLLFDLVTVSL